MKAICPVCKKGHCIDSVVYTNVENYGSGTHKLCCIHCHAPIVAGLFRTVIITSIKKGTHTTDDWNNKCKINL